MEEKNIGYKPPLLKGIGKKYFLISCPVLLGRGTHPSSFIPHPSD
jgi:hypothetical protein